MEFKKYLGDSVYVSYDGYYIWLTTENGYSDDPRNKITLEPEVYFALLKWVEITKQKLTERAIRAGGQKVVEQTESKPNA